MGGSVKVRYDVSHVPPARRLRVVRDPEPGERAELPGELVRYRVWPAEELGSFPPVEWLIPRRLPARELVVFWGRGDTFKSFCAFDWAAQLAHQGHTVLYVAAEGASGLRAREAAWRAHHGVESFDGRLHVMPASVNLHDPEAVERWIRAMRLQLPEDPVLVVIDTLARNYVGGDENNPKDLGLFVDGCERIRVELRTAVLVIHHSTKDGKAERGVEALRNASFAMYRFKREGGRGGLVTVACDRMKDASPPPDWRLRPVVVPLPEIDADASSLVVSSAATELGQNGRAAAELSPAEAELLAAMRGEDSGVVPAEIAERLGWGSTKFRTTAKSLQSRGMVKAVGSTSNRVYTLTDKGRG